VIADVSDEPGEALAREIGAGSLYVPTDCMDEDAIAKADKAAAGLGPLRAAVITHIGPAVALLMRVGELVEANQRLEARVAGLERRLKRSSRNSSLPPSHDPPSAPPRRSSTSTRPAGRAAADAERCGAP
jgi:hypothetical protein